MRNVDNHPAFAITKHGAREITRAEVLSALHDRITDDIPELLRPRSLGSIPANGRRALPVRSFDDLQIAFADWLMTHWAPAIFRLVPKLAHEAEALAAPVSSRDRPAAFVHRLAHARDRAVRLACNTPGTAMAATIGGRGSSIGSPRARNTASAIAHGLTVSTFGVGAVAMLRLGPQWNTAFDAVDAARAALTVHFSDLVIDANTAKDEAIYVSRRCRQRTRSTESSLAQSAICLAHQWGTTQ